MENKKINIAKSLLRDAYKCGWVDGVNSEYIRRGKNAIPNRNIRIMDALFRDAASMSIPEDLLWKANERGYADGAYAA